MQHDESSSSAAYFMQGLKNVFFCSHKSDVPKECLISQLLPMSTTMPKVFDFHTPFEAKKKTGRRETLKTLSRDRGSLLASRRIRSP